jgi:hypothetical protein
VNRCFTKTQPFTLSIDRESGRAGDVATVDSRVRIRVRELRAGRCFELAYRGLIAAGEGIVLVHGTVDRLSENLVHSWLLDPTDGAIYDPVLDEFFASEDEFIKRFDATVEVRYSREDAIKAAVANQHCGPWHRDPGPEPDPDSANGPWMLYAVSQVRAKWAREGQTPAVS